MGHVQHSGRRNRSISSIYEDIIIINNDIRLRCPVGAAHRESARTLSFDLHSKRTEGSRYLGALDWTLLSALSFSDQVLHLLLPTIKDDSGRHGGCCTCLRSEEEYRGHTKRQNIDAILAFIKF